MTLVAAGFVDVEIPWQGNIFAGAGGEESAADFGTVGIDVRARKARTPEEWETARRSLECNVPPREGLKFAALSIPAVRGLEPKPDRTGAR